MTTGDKFQRHSFKLTFKLKVKSVRGRVFTFDIFKKKKNELLAQVHMRASASCIGAGAGAGAAGAGTLCPEPEQEPESEPQKSFLGAGAVADQKCHDFASLHLVRKENVTSFVRSSSIVS